MPLADASQVYGEGYVAGGNIALTILRSKFPSPTVFVWPRYHLERDLWERAAYKQHFYNTDNRSQKAHGGLFQSIVFPDTVDMM